MPVNYPKFDKKIQDHIDLARMQNARTRPGIIVGYSKQNNTANIILDEQYSDQMGSSLRNVPCPITQGLQTVSPVLGTRCLVGFRDNNESSPYVLNYFEDNNANIYFNMNYGVRTGVPRFMVR